VPRQFPIRASDKHFLIPALVSNGREVVLIRDFDDGGCLELQLKGHAMLSSLAAKYNAFAPPPAQVSPTAPAYRYGIVSGSVSLARARSFALTLALPL
jgi:hypothetical protein